MNSSFTHSFIYLTEFFNAYRTQSTILGAILLQINIVSFFIQAIVVSAFNPFETCSETSKQTNQYLLINRIIYIEYIQISGRHLTFSIYPC